MKFINWSC